MAKITFTSITGSFASVVQLNASFQQIADELNDKVLYRVNPVGEPNTISNDIDLNSNNLLNGDAGAFVSLTINGVQVTSPDIVTAPTASQVANVPAGDIVAITVQAAIDELDTEKAPLASPALTGTPTAPTPSAGDSDTSIATTAFVNTGFVDQDSETGAANLPVGTTAQRPANGAGKVRFNSTTSAYEGNDGSAWNALVVSASETVAGIAELATQAETDAGTDDTRIVTPLKLNNSVQTASAWVNFNGTGTVAIRDQFNISSITDNGVGLFSINFNTNLADTNYSWSSNSITSSSTGRIIGEREAVARSVSSFDINLVSGSDGTTEIDTSIVMVQVFGGNA